MAFALKLILIMFMINLMLYLGGYTLIDQQNGILGFVFDTNTLDASTNNPQYSSTLLGTIPQNQTIGQNVGNTFGALFTPVIFLFGLVSFLINIAFAPLALFNIAGMPFVLKLVFGGGLFIAEIMVMLSLLSGRDI